MIGQEGFSYQSSKLSRYFYFFYYLSTLDRIHSGEQKVRADFRDETETASRDMTKAPHAAHRTISVLATARPLTSSRRFLKSLIVPRSRWERRAIDLKT
jgi:hypothetical protein